MNTFSSKFLVATAALVLTAGVAMAQTAPTPAAKTPAPVTTPAVAKTPKASTQKKASTPEGIECSSQADAKGLKGKARRSFRSKCISGLRKAGGVKKQ